MVERAYDAAGQLTTVTDWAEREFAFDWNDDGQLASVTYPNGVVTSRERDAAGRLTGMTTASAAGMDLLNMAYGYTDGGLLEDRSVTRGAEPAQTSTYAWDDLARVDAVAGDGGGDVAFDAAGSVTLLPDGRAMAYDDGRQLVSMTTPGAAGLSDVTTTFTYDARGNRLTSMTDTGPTAGTAAHTFDLENRLTSVTGVDGDLTSYAYDGHGLRASATSGGVTEAFVWDVAAAYPLLLVDSEFAYIYGAGGVPVAQESSSDGSVDYLHTDEVGSVVATTDASGAVTSEAEYDLFGVVQDVGSAVLCSAVTRFGYAGEYTDPTGYVYLRARYYDPTTAQFITVDPLVDTTGTPYGYTGGNPLQFGDPLGLDWLDNVGNFAAGFGDTVTFGGTRWVREQLGVNGAVDTCSAAYGWGGYTGVAAQDVLAFGSGGLYLAYDAIGVGMSARDAYAALEAGDYAAAAIAAVGALPGVPGGARGASDAATAATRGGRAAEGAANTGRALPSELAVGRNAEAGVHVYHGVDAGKPVYAGITNDIARRQSQHGERFVLEQLTPAAGVTRGQARAIEEALIVRNPGFQNARHEISPSHSWYQDALDWGNDWLRGQGL